MNKNNFILQRIKKYLLFFLPAFFCGSFIANASDIALAPDELFALNFNRVYASRKPVSQEVLPLSAIRKVNGKWDASESERVSGQLDAQILEFDLIDTHRLKSTIQAFVSQHKLERIFSCEGLSCGRSSAWANEIFQQRLLNGVSRTQLYSVWKSDDAWYSAYIVERGNQRVYVYWQTIELENPGVLAKDDTADKRTSKIIAVIEDDYLVLTQAESLLGDDDIDTLAKWFISKSTTHFAVVGHSQDKQISFEQGQTSSLKAAQFYSEQLTKAFPNIRFSSHGVGALAPRKNHTDIRIEIVPIYQR